MKHFLMLWGLCLLLGCSPDAREHYLLEGAWTLRQIDYPIGHTQTFLEQEKTFLRLYDGDSVMYQCWMSRTSTGLILQPRIQRHVTLIDKGGGEHLYLEDGDPWPLTVDGDSVIVIQQNGVRYTFHRADDIAREWHTDIKDIFHGQADKRQGRTTASQTKDDTGAPQNYVLSARERRQDNIIHGFVYLTFVVILLLLFVARIARDNRREKRRLQLQLHQIQEARQERPQAVRQAIESVESAYFASDGYAALQRRIATGQLLKAEDWSYIEDQLRRVYPGFGSQLRGLHAMSELEYQVCLLIKLRIAPKDMAAVLARDMSTISTVRSRLYKKVFGQKGGARDWDEFILSM